MPAAKKETKEVELKDLKKEVTVKETESTESNDKPASDASETIKYEVKKDKLGRSYATGKRKDAVARVWIKAGKGEFSVNGKKIEEFFGRPILQMIANQPFEVTKRLGSFDVKATVKGGGKSGQAGAIKHGISKALVNFEPELRPILKKEGYLTRDSRVVERKKFGHKKARKSFQFSKR